MDMYLKVEACRLLELNVYMYIDSCTVVNVRDCMS